MWHTEYHLLLIIEVKAQELLLTQPMFKVYSHRKDPQTKTSKHSFITISFKILIHQVRTSLATYKCCSNRLLTIHQLHIRHTKILHSSISSRLLLQLPLICVQQKIQLNSRLVRKMFCRLIQLVLKMVLISSGQNQIF